MNNPDPTSKIYTRHLDYVKHVFEDKVLGVALNTLQTSPK
jgi:hypothetical protein